MTQATIQLGNHMQITLHTDLQAERKEVKVASSTVPARHLWCCRDPRKQITAITDVQYSHNSAGKKTVKHAKIQTERCCSNR
jgi:hypothetical protein